MMLYIICTPRINEREMRTGHVTEDVESQGGGGLKMGAGPRIDRAVSDPLQVAMPQQESALQRLCLCMRVMCVAVCYTYECVMSAPVQVAKPTEESALQRFYHTVSVF